MNKSEKPTKWCVPHALRMNKQSSILWSFWTHSFSVPVQKPKLSSVIHHMCHFSRIIVGKSFQLLKDAAECCTTSLAALYVAKVRVTFQTGTYQRKRSRYSLRGNKARERAVPKQREWSAKPVKNFFFSWACVGVLPFPISHLKIK